jgi:hypothetical protein
LIIRVHCHSYHHIVFLNLKGLQTLKEEISEDAALIDPVYGHGGQSLINLFVSGKGVSYVWDNDKDLGGLRELPNN